MNRTLSRSAYLICCLLLLSLQIVFSQQPAVSPPPDDRFKADILVITAHPDDESLIAGYLARAVLDEQRRVAIVCTTRGDAGQNLVGFEQARSLADIRELEARQALASIGIHEVWFLRAADTPCPDVPDVLRSLERWNHGNVLSELVRYIRLTRPEVVITMLPDIVVGENHEDHQAAGVVATEAFDLAGDPTWFPEQVGGPEDRLWFSNLIEGLHPWQPKKLYFFTDASHLDFVKGRGAVYSMADVSLTQGISYARLAAKETSFHRTQYDGDPARALETGNLRYYEEPLTLVLGKSHVGGTVTGDIFEGIHSAPISFVRVRGYDGAASHAQAKDADFEIELGGGWAFYRNFWPAHDLDSMPSLLAPELGVGGGQDFPVPLVLRNNSSTSVTFTLIPHLPPRWTLDSNSAAYAHHLIEEHSFLVPSHNDVSVRIRVVAPQTEKSVWQEISWSAEVEGRPVGSATLKVFVEGHEGDLP